MKLSNRILQIILVLGIFNSCAVPKNVMERIESSPKEMAEFPLDYCISLPTPTYEKWDKDYNFYNKYLTKEIMRTQLGMSYTNNGVKIWNCFPAVRTHTQLDTTTIIKDSTKVIGDWRIICNRKVVFTDSAVYADRKVYRNEEIVYDEKDADVFLVISENKFNVFGTEKGESKYKSGGSKKYSIINGRFLMLYGISKASGAMSQIGIDNKGNLIWNSYWVEERKIENKYITYQSTVTQAIFRKQK